VSCAVAAAGGTKVGGPDAVTKGGYREAGRPASGCFHGCAGVVQLSAAANQLSFPWYCEGQGPPALLCQRRFPLPGSPSSSIHKPVATTKLTTPLYTWHTRQAWAQHREGLLEVAFKGGT
jgi:hypothetical protein